VDFENMIKDSLGKILPGAQQNAADGSPNPDSLSALLANPADAAMIPKILDMIQKLGLDNIIKGFQEQRLGKIAQSWVGTGANEPVAPDQLEKALGASQLSALAQETGASRDQISELLSKLLPTLVDKLTPNGQVAPGANDMLSQATSFLKSALAPK
jgi:uncharacterized protein YidB (DUF937 family)